MKKLIALVAVTGLVLTATVTTARAETKVGLVDLQKVFDGYWKTKEADAALKEKAAEMDKQYKSLAEDWQKSRDEFQKLAASANDAAVSTDERDKRKKSADAKRLQVVEAENTIESFRRSAAATLDEKKKQMRDKILVEIRAVVDTKSKAAGCTHVLDSAAQSINATPILLYTTGENEMTDAVLTELNATAPKK
jgi:outer membrane protein